MFTKTLNELPGAETGKQKSPFFHFSVSFRNENVQEIHSAAANWANHAFYSANR